jgi:XTP/dITP diphosphohydrolase
MKIYFATSNKGKIKSAAEALALYGVEVEQLEIELAESREEDPAMIALEKAQQAYKKFGHPIIVEDSGFFIEALGGFPMTHIKFSIKTLGIENILKMLDGLENRKAEWRMSVAYVWGKENYKIFTFIEKGEISKELRPIKREMMSDYWRIYIPKMIAENEKALCELADSDLEKWKEYYRNNNQFKMFGDWISKDSNHNKDSKK